MDMNKDPKVFNFGSKDDLIIYTSLIIELSIKHLDRHRRYLVELEKSISSNEEIKYRDYKEIEDKLNTPQNYLLNLFGDRSKNAASYFRIRKVMKEKFEEFDIPYLEHDQKTLEIINSLSNIRNYEHHFTDAKIMEWGLYRLNQVSNNSNLKWPTEKIEINYYEYIKKKDAMLKFTTSKNLQESFVRLLQLMKKDYSLMIGKSMRVEKSHNSSQIPEHNYYISLNGQNRHFGKKR